MNLLFSSVFRNKFGKYIDQAKGYSLKLLIWIVLV